MYYEDYDICLRAKKYVDIYIDDNIKIIHKYTRTSRKNIKFLYMHIKSISQVLFRKYTGKYKFKEIN